MIETKRLGYFVQVAESGSLSKASESLHIAQPALSRQIQILESYLGFPLFIRTGRGMQLTKEGQYLRDAVIGPLRDLELAVENLRSFLGRTDITFGIGVHHGIAPLIGKPLLDAVVAIAPKVKFCFREAASANLLGSLKRGEIDFAVIDCPSNDEGLQARLLATENLVLVAKEGQAGRPGKRITLKQLTQYPLALPPQGSEIRNVLENAFKQISSKPEVRLETDSPSLFLELVKAGSAAAVMPESIAKNMLDNSGLSLSYISSPDFFIGTYLATRSYGEVEGSLISRIDAIIENVSLAALQSE